jgi:hypothetical protein
MKSVLSKSSLHYLVHSNSKIVSNKLHTPVWVRYIFNNGRRWNRNRTEAVHGTAQVRRLLPCLDR